MGNKAGGAVGSGAGVSVAVVLTHKAGIAGSGNNACAEKSEGT